MLEVSYRGEIRPESSDRVRDVLAAQQDFLERGYHSFRAMNGADEFLETIDRRERALMERILAGTDTL